LIQLYDLERDIGEKHNLYDRYPDVVYRLTRLLEKYVEQGRSTPGEPQKNTGQPNIWRSLKVRDDKYNTNPVKHLAVGKQVRLLNNVSLKFTKDGLNVLTDGIRASSLYSDGYWAGVEGDDLEVMLDLGEETKITRVSAGFLEAQAFWIFHPLKVEFSFSNDGKNFILRRIIARERLKADEMRMIKDFSIELKNMKCRFIKMKAEGVKICPGWHKGAGGEAWLFVDEIVVK